MNRGLRLLFQRSYRPKDYRLPRLGRPQTAWSGTALVRVLPWRGTPTGGVGVGVGVGAMVMWAAGMSLIPTPTGKEGLQSTCMTAIPISRFGTRRSIRT